MSSVKPPGKEISLAVRLAAISAAIGVLVATTAAAIGYFALSQQLAERALHELQGKRDLVSHVLSQIASVEKVSDNAHRFGDLLIGHDDLHLAIVEFGKDFPLVSFSQTAVQSIVCCANNANAHALTHWLSGDGVSFASLAGVAGVANGDTVRFVLSQNRMNDIRLLRGYVTAALLGMPLLLGLVLLGAWGVARTGLAPLARFKKLARESSTVSLAQRLQPNDMPLELRDLAIDFNAMLARIDTGVAHLNHFSGDLAHEMRTPVGILLGRTQVALSRPRSAAELRAVLESDVEDLERLSRLIGDMLFLARAENETKSLSFETVLLNHEARTVAEFIDVIAAERGISIEIKGDATVQAEAILLQRAITNLLTNAIRHAEPNSTIRIEVVKHSNAVEFSVENVGAIIAAEDLRRIFERFHRVDESRSRHSGGAGLGLAIVKKIMRLHGGEIDVTSTTSDDGRGTTRFTLIFPNPAPPAIDVRVN